MKFGLVDLSKGELIGEKIKIQTPIDATPESISTAIQEVLPSFKYTGDKIGVGFPAIIQDGVSLTATNIHPSWIGVNVEELFQKATGHTYRVCNDADAAGIAECRFGRIKDIKGTVLMLTLGTGIGSALFYDGVLIPNTEFGHIRERGKRVEQWVGNKARKDRNLSYDDWAIELAEFLEYMILLLSPRLIVLGGGVSKNFDEYGHHFQHLHCPVVNATAFNNAGIIGAALYANFPSR